MTLCTVLVGSLHWTVTVEEGLREREKCVGITDCSTLTVRLDAEHCRHPEQLRLTLAHELTHALDYERDLHLSEHKADQIGAGWAALLEANRAVLGPLLLPEASALPPTLPSA